jgi:hypothetical protein
VQQHGRLLEADVVEKSQHVAATEAADGDGLAAAMLLAAGFAAAVGGVGARYSSGECLL